MIRSAMYSSIEEGDRKNKMINPTEHLIKNSTPELVPILSRSHNTLFKYKNPTVDA